MKFSQRVLICAALALVMVAGVGAKEVYLYDMQWGSYGTGDGQFNQPGGLDIHGGRVVVTDTSSSRLQVFDLDGNFLSKFASGGQGPGEVFAPADVAYDNAMNIYVADTLNYRIVKRNPEALVLTSWGSQGAGTQQFDLPTGIAVDRANGWVYVADRSNGRVSKWTTAGVYVRIIGSDRLVQPMGVDVDSAGNLYVVDATLHQILKFNANGGFLKSWGGLFYPYAIAVTPTNEIVVGDAFGQTVKKFTANGTWLCTFGGPGSGNGQLAYSRGVAVDDYGRVYVSDMNNHRIQRFVRNLLPTTPTSVTITPSAPRDNNSLKALATGSTDGDGDTLSYRYQWYYGTNNASWTAGPTTAAVGSALTTVGQYWKVAARAYDGKSFSGRRYSATVLIRPALALAAMTATAQQTAAGIAVTVQLAADAELSGAVCNMAGRTVATLPQRQVAAGTSSFAVQALSTTGTKLPAGQYLLTLLARAEDGQSTSVLVPLSLR